jgi:hypothetical protein
MWLRHYDKQAQRDISRKNITSLHPPKPHLKALHLQETTSLQQLCAGKHDTTIPHNNLANLPHNSADSLWQINQASEMLRAKK